MIESKAQKALWPWGTGTPATVFAMLAVGLLCAIVPLSYALYGTFALPVLVFLGVAAISMHGLRYSYPHDVLGACNAVTLGRAALVAMLAGAILNPAPAWAIFSIATIAFALDGLDGWLARRAGLSSGFGARFDMEVDALLGAVLALVILMRGTVGAEILVLGFARYVFVLAALIWPALQGNLPDSFRRKAGCVVQISALIMLLFPLTPPWLLTPVTLVGAAVLLYSFAVDAIYLMRQKP
tara:strand:- start:275 stop:994 length:720 start_codon:yes stop_codon:yes gene_type:complete